MESSGVPPYSDPKEHLAQYLVLIRLFLQRHLILYTDRYMDSRGEPSATFVSRREVESFMRMDAPPPEVAEAVAEVEGVIASFRAHMAARLTASADMGLRFPVEDLRAAFNLNDWAVDCLVALAAPELDSGFARAYSHAWCDFTRRHIDLAFLVDLVAGDGPGREAVREAIEPGSPLVRHGLVEVGLSPDQPATVRYSERPLKAADRVVAWLRGRREPDEVTLGRAARVLRDRISMDRLLLPERTKTAFVEAFREARSGRKVRGVLLVGAVGSGRRSLVLAAIDGQTPVIEMDVTNLPKDSGERRVYLRDVVREAVLLGAPVFLTGVENLLSATGPAPELVDVFEHLALDPGPVVVGVPYRISLRDFGEFIEVEVPSPEPPDQERLWNEGLKASCRLPCSFTAKELVARYSLSGGTIMACCREIGRWADTIGRKAKTVPLTVAVDAIRGHLGNRLSSLAVPVYKGDSWEDLVLPDRTMALLREITAFFRHRHRIVQEWGLGAKLLKSPGVPCMFCGQPGTGKTMAAAIIARELGRELFQVDLSRIVDKYIGETEKNLARVFEEAARAQAILLFDEADSLFARRTDVRTSVDRYANLEVNYLLQRVETYGGITILTTNFPGGIDEAFKRRLRFWVEFPFPEKAERVRLWQTLMPKEVPTTGELDFDELAERYVVSGGHIRNIIIRAATLAAEAGRPVDMAILRKAGDAEYRLMGKLVREDTED